MTTFRELASSLSDKMKEIKCLPNVDYKPLEYKIKKGVDIMKQLRDSNHDMNEEKIGMENKYELQIVIMNYIQALEIENDYLLNILIKAKKKDAFTEKIENQHNRFMFNRTKMKELNELFETVN